MSHVYFAPVFGLMPVQCLMYFDGSLSCLLNSWNNKNEVDHEYFPYWDIIFKGNNHQYKNMKQKNAYVVFSKKNKFRTALLIQIPVSKGAKWQLFS
jgi:hypothetical protein